MPCEQDVTERPTAAPPALPLPPAPPLHAAPPLHVALAGYPHIATCPICRQYAGERAELADVWTIVAAALGHHDSGHHRDILLTASEHFGHRRA
jgi:hypothetical protein